MGLAEAYGKMMGPHVQTTTVSQPGSLGQGILGAVEAVVPWYLMTEMQKQMKTNQGSFLEQLMKLFKELIEGKNAAGLAASNTGGGPYINKSTTPTDITSLLSI